MGEMVQVQVGQAGHRIGYSFWQQLVKEHGLDGSGKPIKNNQFPIGKVHKFFSEQSDGSYKARALLADMNSSYIDDVYGSALSGIFRFENLCSDGIETRNLWPIGYKSALKETIEDHIRREVEMCDRLAGFNFIHSLCGGTGSGLGSMILEKLSQSYPSSVIMTISGMPSLDLSNIVVQPYNTMLTVEKLGGGLRGHPTILFQNEAILKIHSRTNPKEKGTFEDVNRILGVSLANLTSPMRFSCDGNMGYLKMSQNLIHYPALKFLTMSLPCNPDPYPKIGNAIKHGIFNSNNWSLSSKKKIRKNKWMSNYFILRGDKSSPFDFSYQISEELKRKALVQTYRRLQFKDHYIVKFLPHSYITSVTKPSAHRPQNSLMSIQNSSLVFEFINEIHEKASKMFRKSAFLHSYLAEGIELSEMTEAQSSLIEVSQEYQQLMEDGCNCCGGEEFDQ